LEQKIRKIMSFLRKSKLFQRQKMQPLEGKDFLKVAAIIGIIVVPIVVGLFL